MVNKTYKATPTLGRFHKDDSFYRGLRGPVGSGKSTACVLEIILRAHRQAPGPDGIRRSRWVVVRNTYQELRDTTLRTWLDWVNPDIWGPINNQQMIHHLKGNSMDCEVMFRALDRPDDVKKLLSLEITGAWANEARELPKSVIDAMGDRAGRYPPMSDGGATWSGVIMDTNPPDEDHWWYRLAEEERPDGWSFYSQPPGLLEEAGRFLPNPEAENLENLPSQYYERRRHGKDPDYIRVYYCGMYGFVRDGKPVYPQYVDNIHCWHEPLEPVAGLPIYIGLDFGLTPAATIAQRLPSGRWHVLDEVVTEDMGTVRFAKVLKPFLGERYPGHNLIVYGDPAGDQRAQTDESTPFQLLAGAGIKASKAPTNDTVMRREALGEALSRLVDGKPGLIISPRCKVLRKALAGGFCYRRMRVAGSERYHDAPDKNRYSHVVESLEYALLGAGEGAALKQAKAKPIQYDLRAVSRGHRLGGDHGWMGV